MANVRLLIGDVRARLRELPAGSIHAAITSPPYWGLRDYGVEGQLGLEPTLGEHLAVMVDVFAEVRRVMRPEGTVWINYGDCYATTPNGRSAADTKAAGADDRTYRDKPFSTAKGSGLRSGNMCMVPERLAIALQEDGWMVRSRIIWGKMNTKPDSSGRFRPSYNHEMIWMLSQQSNCFYDAVAVRQPTATTTKVRLKQNVANQDGSLRQPGRGGRPFKAVGDVDDRLLRAYEPAPAEVWEIPTARFDGAHTATFPPELAARCILAGTSAAGCCASCGAPVVRVTESAFVPQGDVSEAKGVRGGDGQKPLDPSSRLMGTRRGTTEVTTLGWEPTCNCAAGIVPCTVLDPFGGAGTTGLVAARLNRAAILIELNPEYAAQAEARIKAGRLDIDIVGAVKRRPLDALPLFRTANDDERAGVA